MEEDRQRFRGAEEQHCVDLRNVHAFVVDIHDEDEPHYARNKTLLRTAALLVRRLSRQVHGRDAVLVEIPAHELSMLYRDTEAQAFDLVDVGNIFQHRRYYQVGAAISDHAAERIDFGEFPFVIAARCPFQLIQIHAVRDAEILERTEQFPIDSLRQTDLRRDTVSEPPENALAVHSFRCGS